MAFVWKEDSGRVASHVGFKTEQQAQQQLDQYRRFSSRPDEFGLHVAEDPDTPVSSAWLGAAPPTDELQPPSDDGDLPTWFWVDAAGFVSSGAEFGSEEDAERALEQYQGYSQTPHELGLRVVAGRIPASEFTSGRSCR